VGTLASQVEIGVCVQLAPGRFCGVRGFHYRKNFDTVYEKSCDLVHSWPEMVHNAAHNAFYNTLTMGMTFPHVPIRNGRCPTIGL